MKAGDFRHWLRPQAVPRGFLRLYVLSLLSRGPSTGYSIMLSIDERTDGAWKPGPGTVYPLLRNLEAERLISSADAKDKEGKISYSLTAKGRVELSAMQKFILSAGRKERVMVRLFTDLLPPAAMASMLINRGRESSELLKGILLKIPKPERTALIKELQIMSESIASWAEAQV